MGRIDKPLVWLRGEVKTPPFSQAARLGGICAQIIAAGRISWPAALTAHAGHWAPVHELRINDESCTFRIIYRADTDAVVSLDVLKKKKTQQTPQSIIQTCRRRLREYDQLNA